MGVSKFPEGRWTSLFKFRNVPVHVSLLPNGKVLYWRRRKDATKDPSDLDLNELSTSSFLWTPASGQPVQGELGTHEAIEDVNKPTYFNPETKRSETVNLFCSGHCLLPSGNLLVVGGHRKDGSGVEQASIFDYPQNKWFPQTLMFSGRWYPSVLTLPDGRMLCISGSNQNYDPNINNIPQIFPVDTSGSKPIKWTEVADPNKILALYPRLHVSPTNGQVFMAGPQAESWFLGIKDENGNDIQDKPDVVGRWRPANTQRRAGFRDYAPSVMYASGKIMYIGGGTGDQDKMEPTRMTEFIDLYQKSPSWDPTTVNLKHAHRQFNATILPDGTVLVTGGCKGAGFNDFRQPVFRAELMDPSIEPKQWIEMAEESQSRCYHSTALLLPDGRVLSAGGGEYGGCKADQCHQDAQLFEPPYFSEPRPIILSAQPVIEYKKEFLVTVGTNDLIHGINLIRLGSVTHCCNMGQQLVPLSFKQIEGSKLAVQCPENSNIAPPGYYMLFVLNRDKVPSTASMIRISPSVPKNTTSSRAAGIAQQFNREIQAQTNLVEPEKTIATKQIQPSLAAHNERIIAEQNRPHVAVGITPLCPYGLGPCWGGAHDGLRVITDIDVVRPVPQHGDCLAFVYLRRDIIPNIDVWRDEFKSVANQGYTMRGIEMTISGAVTKGKSGDGKEELTLAGNSTRPEVALAPFQASSQLKWDIEAKAPKAITNDEAGAYKGLVKTLADLPANVTVQVTGTLQKHGANKFSLDVRNFVIPNSA